MERTWEIGQTDVPWAESREAIFAACPEERLEDAALPLFVRLNRCLWGLQEGRPLESALIKLGMEAVAETLRSCQKWTLFRETVFAGRLEHAEDLAQELLYRFYRRSSDFPARFQKLSYLSPGYFVRSIHNELLQILRETNRTRRHEIRVSDEDRELLSKPDDASEDEDNFLEKIDQEVDERQLKNIWFHDQVKARTIYVFMRVASGTEKKMVAVELGVDASRITRIMDASREADILAPIARERLWRQQLDFATSARALDRLFPPENRGRRTVFSREENAWRKAVFWEVYLISGSAEKAALIMSTRPRGKYYQICAAGRDFSISVGISAVVLEDIVP